MSQRSSTVMLCSSVLRYLAVTERFDVYFKFCRLEFNSLNVGILGHVDCGKTTLAKALSSMGSTAAFDKHAKTPNLRANTIDLGYSTLNIDGIDLALIDCPGHASLIK